MSVKNPTVTVLLVALPLAAGAFAVGRMTAPQGAGKALSAEGAKGPRALSQTAGGAAGAEKAGGLARGAEAPDQWASYRDKDGHVSAERMADIIGDVLSDPNPIESFKRFASLLDELTPDNAAAAWKALSEKAQGGDSMRYLPMLAFAWGKIDGAGALAKMKESGGREAGMSANSIMAGWASANPSAAMAWLEAKAAEQKSGEGGKDSKDRFDVVRMLRSGLISGLAISDPAAALKIIQGVPENERDNLLGVLAAKQMKQGLETATSWALGLGDEKLRSQALSEIARDLAQKDTKKAAAWIAGHAADPSAADAIGRIAREWAQRKPDEAIAWAASLPSGTAQSEAFHDSFREWGRRDPTAASTYLVAMADGPAKNAAISAFSRSIVREDPKSAIQWAGAITDPVEKGNALTKTARAWAYSDTAAVQQWLPTSGLNQEQVQQVTEVIAERTKAAAEPGGAGLMRGGGFTKFSAAAGAGGVAPGGRPPRDLSFFQRGGGGKMDKKGK